MAKTNRSILIVDDSELFIRTLSNSFTKKGWIVHTASNGRESIISAVRNNPDIILIDMIMPVMDGIQTVQVIKKNIASLLPVIMMTSKKDKKSVVAAIKAGCDDYIVKPFPFIAILKKVEALYDSSNKIMEEDDENEEHEVIIFARNASQNLFTRILEKKPIDYPAVKKVVNQMVDIVQKESNLPLAFKMKSYNDYTYIHSVNVASLCMSFAKGLGWNKNDLQIVGEGGFFHDIGKVNIVVDIIIKPGKLTDEEFTEIKKHPVYSKELMDKQGVIETSQIIGIEHHEKMNGKGYPYGLEGKQISKYGRLAAIVDVYDALTTDRSYRKALDSEKAIQLMNKMEGSFDSGFFQEFSTLIKRGIIGK